MQPITQFFGGGTNCENKKRDFKKIMRKIRHGGGFTSLIILLP